LKRFLWIICLLFFLSGCAGNDDCLDRVMALRSKLLSQGTEFDAIITADYSDKTYTFGVHCKMSVQGELSFEISAPDTIAGITGTVSSSGGKLTFDDQALAFPTLADGQLTPVSATWVLMNTLRSGYLTSAGLEGDNVRVAIDDSYADNALHLDIWLDGQDLPSRGEILWKGRRILSVEVKNFHFV